MMGQLDTENYEYSILVSKENFHNFKRELEKLGYSWGCTFWKCFLF